MERGFSTYHPIVLFFYYFFIVEITALTFAPILTLLSLLGGALYCYLLNGWRPILESLLLLIPILFFSTIIHPLFAQQGKWVLFSFGERILTVEGVLHGIDVTAVLLSVILWLVCFHRCFHSEKLRYLLGKTFPHIAMVFSMIFRFVPLYRSQLKEILIAQRGLYGKTSVRPSITAIMRSVSVLTGWAVEHSVETADSMSARGYGVTQRSFFSVFHFQKRDGLVLGILLLLTAWIHIGFISKEGVLTLYPALSLSPLTPCASGMYIACLLLSLLPTLILLEEELHWKRFASSK